MKSCLEKRFICDQGKKKGGRLTPEMTKRNLGIEGRLCRPGRTRSHNRYLSNKQREKIGKEDSVNMREKKIPFLSDKPRMADFRSHEDPLADVTRARKKNRKKGNEKAQRWQISDNRATPNGRHSRFMQERN